MKLTLTTSNSFVLFCIGIAFLLSSCSTSNQLVSTNPHYHLALVKANPPAQPITQQKTDNTIAAMPSKSNSGSLISCQPDKQVDELTQLLKGEAKLIKNETKKSAPVLYKEVKSININKAVRQIDKSRSPSLLANTSSVTRTNSDGNGGRDFLLFILFLVLALLFYILAFGAPIFWVFGFICTVAAAIFFVLWIVSLAS